MGSYDEAFFLTGNIQIGKSTALRRTLALLDVTFGGFQTYFGRDRGAADRRLYIGRAGAAPCFEERCAVARFCGHGQPPHVLTERFDTLGTRYIMDAAGSARLIVMDELGSMERDARRFQEAVLSALEGGLPILGVIKLCSGGWVERVRAHPNVAVITVDAKNRDALPEQLARALRSGFPGLG